MADVYLIARLALTPAEHEYNHVPSPSNQYRDPTVWAKNIEMAEFYPTILKCPELGDLRFLYLTE